ncbi:MAG: DUF3667 domain-containing protein [Prevotella sp.]|nr:DUF3667 domain-containing protein [Prevotella sp.]
MLQTINNAIATVSDKRKRTVWLRAFRIWQRRPHEVAPLSEATHECASCATVFQGNYCPRCGQSAQIGRFSFTKAFRLFLDVWGIGNRSMTRTIRDLLLRPGYMIRDYLKGMQSAYFPPFKMFFLLTALSLLVDHGFSLNDEGQQERAEVTSTIFEDYDDNQSLSKDEKVVMDRVQMAFTKLFSTLKMIERKNQPIFALLMLVLFYLPLYYFIRKSPVIPDLRYSEFTVALVYISNMTSIYSILGDLLHSMLFDILWVVMAIVAIRQLSGFSVRKVLWYVILTFLISVLIIVVLISLSVYIIYLFNGGETSA